MSLSATVQKCAGGKMENTQIKAVEAIIETLNVRQKTIGELQELIEKLNKQLEAVKEALK